MKLYEYIRTLFYTYTISDSDQPVSEDCDLSDLHAIISKTFPCTEAHILMVNPDGTNLKDDGRITLRFRKLVEVTKELALLKFYTLIHSDYSSYQDFKTLFPQFEVSEEEFWGALA